MRGNDRQSNCLRLKFTGSDANCHQCNQRANSFTSGVWRADCGVKDLLQSLPGITDTFKLTRLLELAGIAKEFGLFHQLDEQQRLKWITGSSIPKIFVTGKAFCDDDKWRCLRLDSCLSLGVPDVNFTLFQPIFCSDLNSVMNLCLMWIWVKTLNFSFSFNLSFNLIFFFISSFCWMIFSTILPFVSSRANRVIADFVPRQLWHLRSLFSILSFLIFSQTVYLHEAFCRPFWRLRDFDFKRSTFKSLSRSHWIMFSSSAPSTCQLWTFLGLDSDESITRRLHMATAGSSRSRLQRRPSTHHLNSVRARASASRFDCLHISKSRRDHHRKHGAKITSHFALM